VPRQGLLHHAADAGQLSADGLHVAPDEDRALVSVASGVGDGEFSCGARMGDGRLTFEHLWLTVSAMLLAAAWGCRWGFC
jgi:hypothetical protein